MQRSRRWWGICVWLGWLVLVGPLAAQERTLEERVDLLEQAFETSEWSFKSYWKNGLRMETLNQEIQLRIGGRIQFDTNFFLPEDDIEDAFGDPDDRFFFRRARIFIRGTLYKFVEFKAEYDFTGGDAEFQDVYLRLKQIPYVGNFYVGKFKAPFGLEEQTSSRFITFQERSLTDAFVPGRELGFMLTNHIVPERAFWWVALTRVADNDASAADDLNLTLRLAGTPWYAQEGRRLIHVGVAYRLANPVDDTARFRTRPEARIDSLRFVDTGDIAADLAHTLGAEGALVHGPLSAQSEFMLGFLDGDAGNPTLDDDIEDMRLYAFYVMASFFLTGEYRPYDRGSFARPMPHTNFPRGLGAWEVAMRYSHIDLDDAEEFGGMDAGGREANLTFGVNWYPNPNTRVTMNYVYGLVDDRVITIRDDAGNALSVVRLDDDNFGVFMMRFQVDF